MRRTRNTSNTEYGYNILTMLKRFSNTATVEWSISVLKIINAERISKIFSNKQHISCMNGLHPTAAALRDPSPALLP